MREKVQFRCMPLMNCDDITILTGKHWTEYCFIDDAENGSYVVLDTTEKAAERLQDELQYRLENSYPINPIVRIQNEIELVKIFQEKYNYYRHILVYVSW